MRKFVLFAANRGYALYSSRRELIEKFIDSGWHVVLATADDSDSRKLVELGAVLEPTEFGRGGLSVLKDWMASRRLREIIEIYSPLLAHFFHAKPIILGSLAMHNIGNRSSITVNTITGLGNAFCSGGMSAKLASLGYRRALPRANLTIFQNPDDESLFVHNGWISSDRSMTVTGSGVPLDRFSFVERSKRDAKGPVIVMVARLLKQKGVFEFSAVATEIRRKLPSAKFVLAGEKENSHPDRVDLARLQKCPDVEYVGPLSDVLPLLIDADLFLFPSFYREGVPRVVMEAAATGLPTVAFDVPGVREAVRNEQTGFLVPDRNVEQMTERVFQLLEDKGLRLEMGRKASELAKEAFDIRAVQEAYLNVYRKLGVDI
ncbi:MAG: glycosyltransferase family 4 protein [Alteromonadaceae bacterium]|nr:glycosyltransferase family 4 protein [Alteromonadaceae bacterium]